ncbi:hypothetical protein J6590_083547 [Homalodisca vitripennis]|nr:hypothetical protein J6590_083547 [Homalodisca vitripennis]
MLLLGRVTAERSCLCKQPACPALGVGLVTVKPLAPSCVREGFLALTSPELHEQCHLPRLESTNMAMENPNSFQHSLLDTFSSLCPDCLKADGVDEVTGIPGDVLNMFCSDIKQTVEGGYL